MNARIAILILLVSLALSAIAVGQSARQSSAADAPLFSANAVPIYSWPGTVRTSISPDRKKTVRIRFLDNKKTYPAARMTVGSGQSQLSATIPFGLDTEVLWSPDSAAFAITGSCCGANGQYETDVFTLADNQRIASELTPLVDKAFGHPVKCTWPEPPNVAAIKWLVPSKVVVVAAQIIDHSNCDSYGTFKAYAIDVSERRIVRHYGQIGAEKLFGADLGPELLQADDMCITDPKTCWVGVNH